MKKRLLALAVAVVAVLSLLCGCFSSEKTFEKGGMRITLTSNFVEKDIVAQTAYYESAGAIVTALKEEFNLMQGLSEYSLSEYTDLVLSNNKFTAAKQQREGKDYMYFTYEKTVSGKDFYYLATTHKTTDAFWLIQFACTVDKKEEKTETFLKWADSVTFGVDAAAEQ